MPISLSCLERTLNEVVKPLFFSGWRAREALGEKVSKLPFLMMRSFFSVPVLQRAYLNVIRPNRR